MDIFVVCPKENSSSKPMSERTRVSAAGTKHSIKWLRLKNDPLLCVLYFFSTTFQARLVMLSYTSYTF